MCVCSASSALVAGSPASALKRSRRSPILAITVMNVLATSAIAFCINASVFAWSLLCCTVIVFLLVVLRGLDHCLDCIVITSMCQEAAFFLRKDRHIWTANTRRFSSRQSTATRRFLRERGGRERSSSVEESPFADPVSDLDAGGYA